MALNPELQRAWRDVLNTRADRKNAEQALKNCKAKEEHAAATFAKLSANKEH